ncbi:hypothetical protein [Syntrophobacter fumaroxidans]|uniref:Uncharacterized protein n=1 Tax=Syntrophobacter fumaroxidans (strain DSM 10017 / MPOB) TaxID=335543 RepID=A0LIL9_SYNFM|nr:hypothetical protein [Syntrophobacter fumaroxidans]ABK17271.1 hypothetical protein Sfum_1584 [Syntrophobacter fumaroxidans MPOB]
MAVVTKKLVSGMVMLCASAVFVLATCQMLRNVEPFHTWYYSFAWWSVILFFQSVLYRRWGRAILFDNPLDFVRLLPVSVTVWLIFEAFNFRLQNWHYENLPSMTTVRLLGYTIAYATVLPGLFTARDLLERCGLWKNLRCRPLRAPQKLYRTLTALGLACGILPLLWPRYFFPLVWGAFIFLLEPRNHRTGAGSLLRDWENGSPRHFFLLLASGLLCGLLWELWNYWAGSRWVYTVPFVGGLKVFEMPLLGFLGFPPFAVECYAMYCFTVATWAKLGPARKVGLAFGVAAFDLLVFYGIDRLTVLSFSG